MRHLYALSNRLIITLSQYDPFYYLGSTSVTDNEALKNMARSYRGAARSLAIAGVVISMIIVATIYALATNAKWISTAKSTLTFKFIIIIMIFSDVWILSTLYQIFSSMS